LPNAWAGQVPGAEVEGSPRRLSEGQMGAHEDVRERHREIVPIEKPTMAPRAEPEGKQTIVGGANSLIEFTTEKQEDPNEEVVFGDQPVHCSCPHCERSVITFIDYEASWVTYVLGVVVWFSLGWMAFWVLPLLWPAFKDVVHHCPRCLNVIARKSRIALPSFKSEVMTLKVGSCAVVLARKYVVILCGLVGVIITVAILRSTVHISPGQMSRETMPKGPPSMLTWEDFLHECGPRTSLGHRTSAMNHFENHFRKRTFKWQGEVLLIREGFDVFFLHAKSVVMVRMNPPRNPRRDIPDIALLFSDDKNAEVSPLNKGDIVEFEATMTAHGHRGDPEVMALWHIKQVSPLHQADAVKETPQFGSFQDLPAFSEPNAPAATDAPAAAKAPVVTEAPPAAATETPPAAKVPVATEAPPTAKEPAATVAPPAAATEAPPAAKEPAATEAPPAAKAASDVVSVEADAAGATDVAGATAEGKPDIVS